MHSNDYIIGCSVSECPNAQVIFGSYVYVCVRVCVLFLFDVVCMCVRVCASECWKYLLIAMHRGVCSSECV